MTKSDLARQIDPIDGPGVLGLARSGSPAALERLRELSPSAVAEALQQLPARQKYEFLELSDQLGEIVPLLPEVEFISTIRRVGIEDAGWLVAHASPEQRVAAVDLDCWKGARFSPSRFFEWVDAMIEAGPETLVAAFDEVDADIWVLAMKEMGDFSITGLGEDSDGDYLTDDGMVYFSPHSGAHEERLHAILGTALIDSPLHYWSFVYGAIFENRLDSEEQALHWQRGRLNDLGFPDPEYAAEAYRPLEIDSTPLVDFDGPVSADVEASEPSMHIPMQVSGTLIGVALGELSASRGGEVLGYIMAVANTLAVADGLPLADPESVETSFKKALRGIERGLAELARSRDQSLATVLETIVPLDLFRVGVTLDPSLRRDASLSDIMSDAVPDDWNVETEQIAEADQTIGRSGKLQ